MNSKKFAREEFIGQNVHVIECKDPTWFDRSGLIIDETKNTFLLEKDDESKRIAKDIAVFEFEYEGKKILLNGSKIKYRPEDRIKKIR